MVHMHYSQPLEITFGTNHFLILETLMPIQYREPVKTLFKKVVLFFSLNKIFWMRICIVEQLFH